MPTSPPVARVSTPAEIVAVLPLQVGFTPTESLVVLCCHEPRGRMGLTLRIDLPGEGDEGLLATEVEARVRHQGATRVVLAVYTDEPGDRPRRALVEDVCRRLADLVVTEAALVRAGRFWSYLCDDPSCCPPGGTPVDAAEGSAGVQVVRTESVLAGRQVLADRAALSASIAGPVLLAAEAARQRCGRALAELAGALESDHPREARDAAAGRWRAALDAAHDPRHELGPDESAALAASLQDVVVRDELLSWTGADGELLERVLRQLCRAVPAPWDVPVCAALAWVVYCRGGGGLVSLALERALRGEPADTLALLIGEAWQRQVSPKEFAALSDDLRAVLLGRMPRRPRALSPRSPGPVASSRARRRRPSRG